MQTISANTFPPADNPPPITGALERGEHHRYQASSGCSPRSSCVWQRVARIAVLGAVLIMLLPLVVLPQPARAAAEKLPFAAELSADSPGREKGYVYVMGKAGGRYRAAVVVRNITKEALTLHLKAVDATTGTYGGVSYGLPEDETRDVGSWIQLERSSLELAPGATVEVPLSITVPAGAAAGDHVGGIAIWEPQKSPSSVTTVADNQAGAVITIQRRLVIAVHVRVAGPAQPHLTITGVKAVGRPQGLYLDIAMENDGQLLTKGEGLVELPQHGFSKKFDLETFLPQTVIAYPVLWTAQAPSGTYPCHVVLRYDQGRKIAEWRGNVTVGEAAMRELSERLVHEKGAAGGLWGPITWAVLGALGAAVLLLFGLLLRRRRRAAP